MIKPYYEDKWGVIYLGDCREILPELPKVDLVLTDPPYGINHSTDYLERGRSRIARASNYAPVFGDDKPFDPLALLALNVPTVLWGADHYSNKLPIAPGWLVWDKERPDDLDQSTCELAWTNFVKGTRRLRYLWHGMLRAGHEQLVHPTQKPVALMAWVLELKWCPAGVVLDPYMGAGSTLLAAKKLNRHYIGIEISEKYCEIAARRLSQDVMVLDIPEPPPKKCVSPFGPEIDGFSSWVNPDGTPFTL